MLSFSFKSLNLQPPLRTRKRLHLQIELDEGPNHRTECFVYTPYKSVSIDEPLELLVLEPENITSFDLSIYEHGEKGHHDHKIIAEETIDITKVLNKTFTEITLPTIYGTDAVIDMNLEVCKEILDTNSDENLKTENLDYLDSILTGDIFKLSKLIPILHQALLAMSPLIQLKDAIISFLTWEDQMITLGGSVGFTIFMLFGRYLIALGLLIFSIFGKKMIPYMTKMKPVQRTKISKLTIYKNNALFFKDVIRIFLYVVDYYKNIFESHDKTIAVQLLLRLKQMSFFAAIFLFLFPLNYAIICLYWLILLYNTPFGKKSLLYSYSTLFRFLDKIDLKTIYPLKLQKEKSVRKASATISPVKIVKNNEEEYHSTLASLNDLPSNSPNKVHQITKEKVFVVYENQRWWPGKGWRPELLPGERPSWSDDLGLVALMKEDVRLPTGHWEWESDWKYVVTSNTDEEGWEYASRFKRFEQADKPDRGRKLLRTVRRRKWIRRCICFDE